MTFAHRTWTMGRRFVRSNISDALVRSGGPEADDPSSRLVSERVVITTDLDPFLSLRAVAAYAGLSVRTLRQYLDLPPDQALPCYRVGGKILVRRSEFDGWIRRYHSRGRPELARALRDFGLDRTDA
jgi:excisionase family DNA binding protein